MAVQKSGETPAATAMNETGESGQLEEMLRQTTKDNEQLKKQLAQMIDLNSKQQMQLAVQQAKNPFQKTNTGAPFTPIQAYSSADAAGSTENQTNPVANIIESRPLSKDKTARPIQTPGS